MKFDPSKEPADYSDAELIATLTERYTATPVPPCRVCGGPLSIARAGGGEATVWACHGLEDDPDNPDRVKRQPGRSAADEHYVQSRWTQYRTGDELVLEALTRLQRSIAQEGLGAQAGATKEAQ